ncbi:serine/threonine protein kinase [Paracoccidioides brasiliensis Pb18]|uniref:Serine/threonine protein kinase n=1 Tax=Paracoccidioides brasiliensis (strain Pb18) TaxID=502780 RepID=C1G9K2_PARBD|nr:serine/threonine protein kinase [Paracoccidioides brasiliensis Pb18]EEH47854.2 serine/threonine protein kinase [Paracoccidioides brasiliensis Pb18]
MECHASLPKNVALLHFAGEPETARSAHLYLAHRPIKRYTQFNLGPLGGDGLSSQSPAPNQTPNKRKGSPSQQELRRKLLKGMPRDLSLPAIVSSAGSMSANLAGPVAVVEHIVRPSTVLAIREFPKESIDETLDRFKRIRHDNIILALECFRTADLLHVVFEHQPVSLDHLVACRKWPSEIQLASVVAQILNGLSHLAANGLEHRSLSGSSVLVGYDGSVKIARLESCQPWTANLPREREIKALGVVVMELMDKDAKEDGAVGVNDLQRWPSGSNAVGFLSATTSTDSLDELKKHPLVTRRRWSKGYLVRLVSFALISTRTFYSGFD